MLKVEYIVNSIFDSITWLLSETESNQVWLVDCGDVKPVLDRLKNKVVVGVLLTHAHFDHIYGLPELITRYPNCVIYTNIIGQNTLADAQKNLSLYHETPLSIKGRQVVICGECSEILLFQSVMVKIFETPGHHPSCLTYMVGDYLFTGDAYIPGVKIVTNLPKGNKMKAQESLERIKTLAEGKRICPGHQV